MKQIQLTDEIRASLQASLGEGVDVARLVVFEAIAANLNPLRRRTGLYNGARFTESMLNEMVVRLEKESVPLQLQHDTGELPSGRVFMGRVEEEQLHILFFLDPTTEGDLVQKINAGVIDQVSVGIVPKRLLCSECGFDYLGPDATWENLISESCNEGHQIGKDGVHLRMAGLDQWFETSLVGQGAVDGAKIVSGSKSAFSDRSPAFRLAASAIALHTNLNLQEEDPEMDLKAAVDQITNLSAEKATVTAALSSMTSERDAAKTDLAAANTELESLRAENATLKAADNGALQEKVTNLTASNDAAIAFLKKQAEATCVALSITDPEIPETVEGLTKFLDEKQAALSAVIPTGPVARTQGVEGSTPATFSSTAFKSARSQ